MIPVVAKPETQFKPESVVLSAVKKQLFEPTGKTINVPPKPTKRSPLVQFVKPVPPYNVDIALPAQVPEVIVLPDKENVLLVRVKTLVQPSHVKDDEDVISLAPV